MCLDLPESRLSKCAPSAESARRRRQRVQVHRAVVDAHLPALVDPAQRVLHPVHVVAIREILARMRAAALLAFSAEWIVASRLPSRFSQLQRLDEVGVPDQRAVGDA